MDIKECLTPVLVRLYREIHVKGAQSRLSDGDQYQLDQVVAELRFRGILD